MNPFLFDTPILPSNFKFPRGYLEIAKTQNWPDIAPWRFLGLDMGSSLSYYDSMLQMFPQKPLVPFAIISDESGYYNDGYVVLACFECSDSLGEPMVRIYDHGKPKISPWENLAYSSFSEWLLAASEESSRYKAERAEFVDEE